MICSCIDVGTNTVLLLVAEISPGGIIRPLLEEARTPRLGEGVDARGCLRPDAMRKTLRAVEDSLRACSSFRGETPGVFGTSALRDAQNGRAFAGLLRRRTGLDLEVLSGREEALLSFRGAVSGLGGPGPWTVLDVGGGSTEVTAGCAGDVRLHASLDVGALRITERFFAHDPPQSAERHAAEDFIEARVRELDPGSAQGAPLVAVAGTATSLAILDQGLRHFSVDAVSGYRLTRGRLEELCTLLQGLPARGIRPLADVMEGRADIIFAGALILRAVLRRLGKNEALVSDRGLRYGIALREWERRTARRPGKEQG